ncbi:helix-turn-helix domain-containing protein [Spongiivirga citrea]|uniref:Helix-turn-helix domain-containing protein n=1 Tax=Spongiivirga citrea TaxID=1481457 RepID=A0A6M0CNS9_9FLAO|nr:AraC family transcriptional regulator [Spongiivirga citrea]NER17137.1 helix-turn-helix domain-containing protein [Spongiivirga citrea]
MIFEPSIPEIQKHIDHYWIINDFAVLTKASPFMYAYPGITPDMIIVLEGHYKMTYMGQTYQSNRSMLFSFIHEHVYLDLSQLKRCIIIKFKSRGLSSLQPFVKANAERIMKDSVAFVNDVFDIEISHFLTSLNGLSSEQIAASLDEWFLSLYNKEDEGFIVEMAQEVSDTFDIKTIMNATGYSYSTIERYFKRDTGLTPKRFQSLKRYKLAIRELYVTRNSDWQHYVAKYGYYDQSHFIKEIKRYTNHTPARLLNTPAFIEVRPLYL